ncbi:probable disease resistance protein At5g47260 [Raphanus sativus]|uniref:non-specific serine/threonine protein kinase n=1 Tax=Raphanus sativus TaxID=3726 RepID=A0A9W3D255_RAPSA|nr:probable disease resistance protein At5g47260 [Raphanus sativus]
MVSTTLNEAKDVRSKGVFKVIVERTTPLSYVKNMLPLHPIVSRKTLLEKAWECLMGNGCGSLGFYGVAGVGKTTLLTQLKNKFTEDGDASSLVIFVPVEPEEEVEGIIQHEIWKRLGQIDKEEKASAIFEILSVKRFVLLLDGIHRKLDLEDIGVPEPTSGNGCKIVFTTRSRETCRGMGTDTEVEVECLSPEEAWDFFQGIVGETTLKSHPDIPQLARIICGKCGGLPVALCLIGETMSRKTTVREWHHAISVLVSSTTEDELLPNLKFTYDNLHGESIRSCFLYCAMFPRSCDISKKELVDCWIAEGMIEEEEDREIAEIKGYEMIADLVMMRLLIDDESGYGVTMNGIVREMALWIASECGRQKEKFVVVGGMGIHQMPEVNDLSKVRRMSVTSTQVNTISNSPNCLHLTTFFLQENSLTWISHDFFRWMTSLVVLNLSRNRELDELPEQVSSLVSLRLLNLSRTKISRLPLGLKRLKRLIHLDLEYTSLLREVEVIGYLLNLQVLRLLRSVPMDLSLMEDIQLLKSLRELSLTVREVDVLKRLQTIDQLASCIRHLHLTGITIKDGGTLLLNSMLSLRELDVRMCDIPEIIITIQRETIHFGNIQKIPNLLNIRRVALSWCTGLRDLTWLLLAPNLSELRVHECQQIEHIINKEKATGGMSEQPFRNLTRLGLDSLPRLESIYWTPLPFPVLKYLYIRGCPKLRRLPFSTKGHQVRSDIYQEWIKGVEWEDQATKQHLSNYDDRDFPKIPEEQKMDGLASESHPIEEIVLVETLGSGKGTTTNSITEEVQSGTHATVEHTQTYRYLTPDCMISNRIDNRGVGRKAVQPSGVIVTPSLKKFSLVDLKTATKNFRPESMIEEGGFGQVFKGWLEEKTLAPSRAGVGIPVAVKKSSPDSTQGLHEWQCEVRFLGKFHHPNLVKLLGYCWEENQFLLVYEYLPKGSLENHLFSKGEALTWDTRLKIVIEAAEGLNFLHNSEKSVIYRDFKASNILLDSNFHAKLSDFGLAKLGPINGVSHVTTRVMGTQGYAAPEYMATGHLYVRSDVYGFGVVLLEILTGLRALDPNRPPMQLNLVEWAKPSLTQKKKIQKMMDPRLEHKYPISAVIRTAALILRCLEEDPKNRPPMDEVLRELEIVRSMRDEPKEEKRKRSSGGPDNNRINRNGSPHVRRTGRTR